MKQDKLLIIFVALCAIGFSFIEAFPRNVCQYNVQVPYTRNVNNTELKEKAYKIEIQAKCCPGYVGPVENCQLSSTTPHHVTLFSGASPSGVTTVATVGVTESSTRIYHVMESSENSTETASDNTKASEYSTTAQSDNTTTVTEAFPETTAAVINTLSETIATKTAWTYIIWFVCIVALVAFVAVLLKVLVHRHNQRAYVVNKKCASTELDC